MVASEVRFVPWSAYERISCMRVELHGCDWKGRWWSWEFSLVVELEVL